MVGIIDLAQKLGEQLAKTSLSWQFLHKENNDDYVTLELIPYKHLADTLTQWYGVLRSFVWSKAKVYMGISWNKSELQLYISVPSRLLPTLQASLYTNIKDIDSKIIPNPSISWLQYAHHNNSDANKHILRDIDFKKDGQYIDPFMDVVSLFEQVTGHTLHISYCIDFDPKQSLIQKIGGMFVSSVFNKLSSSLGSETQKQDNASVGSIETRFSFGYYLGGRNSDLESTINNTFSKFCRSGHWKRSGTRQTMVLGLDQIINFFHLPHDKIVDNLNYLSYRKLPFPSNIPTLDKASNKNDLTIIWKTEFRNQNITFGITREDKLRHMYIIGKTWVGKSNLIANLARSDMISNKGICVIDPHGDLIDDIIGQVPSYRINDIVLFDVSDRERPVGFNVLEHEKPEEKPLIASGIISIFKKLFGHSRWPRLEYILRNVLLSILEYPNSTLMHVLRMLTDSNFRQEVLEYVKDPLILNFRKDEFDTWPDKQREEAISPISNKIGQFTSSSIIRNIFGQTKSKINFRKLMDEGKIVLVNLSKWKIGEDNTNLLGSFIVSKIQIDAMSRADMDEDQRKDFYLYIDEFQNFATESFATILSEARKYRLGLILANQYSSQLDEVTRGAIFGNVGTMISMTLGYDDAVIMANQFKGMVSANDFLDIPKYKAYIKLMIHWIVSDPFNFQTIALPPWDNIAELKEKIKTQSRTRYAIGRLELEELIKTWAERSFSKTQRAIDKAKARTNGIKEVVAVGTSVKSSEKIEQEKIPEVKSAETDFYPSEQNQTKDHKPEKVIIEASDVISDNVINKNTPKSSPIEIIDADDDQKSSTQLIENWESVTENWPTKFNPIIFQKLAINNKEPDYILWDNIKHDHKFIFLTRPQWIESVASIDPSRNKWTWYKKGSIKVYKVIVEMRSHKTIMSPDKAWIDIWVWEKEEIKEQILNGFSNEKKWFLVKNTKDASEKEMATTEPTKKTTKAKSTNKSLGENDTVVATDNHPQMSPTPSKVQKSKTSKKGSSEIISTDSEISKTDQTTENWITEYAWIKVGKSYEWYVKLKYNYGLFVTVGDMDGLLHKSTIDCPEGVSRKRLYEIGDPIIVQAREIKEVDGKVSVVWTQV